MSYTALKAASLYLLLGLVWISCYSWIWLSLAARFPSVNPALLQYLLHAFFIAGSAILIYVLVRKDFRKNIKYSEQYRQLFYEHPVPMWIYDWKTLRFLAVNNAAIQKYGYSRKEFQQMSILDIRDPSTVPQVLEDVKKTIQHIAYRGIWQHRKKDREVFAAEIYSHSTKYRGRDARIVMAIDVDAEIRSTIMAKDIGTRYELLAQVTQDYIYYWDIATNHVTRNHGPASLFGYKEEEILNNGDWWKENVHPDDIGKVMTSVEQAMRNGDINWEEEYRFRCADGQYKYVNDRGYIIYNDQKQPVRMIGAVQDIDDNTRQKHEIELLSMVASRTINSVLITNAAGEIEWVNEGFVQQTGYSLTESIGRRPRELLSGPSSNERTLQEIDIKMASKKPFSEEYVNYKKNGDTYWVKMDVTPILQEDGNVFKFVSIQTDITERKKFVNQLQHQNEVLQEIARINSHDIRKPVASILGIVSVMDLDKNEPALNSRLLQMLQESTKELDAMLYKIQDNLKKMND